jgi:hypothetical protein
VGGPFAADYAVQTYWHFDLGVSGSYYGTPVILIMGEKMVADLIQAWLDPRVR